MSRSSEGIVGETLERSLRLKTQCAHQLDFGSLGGSDLQSPFSSVGFSEAMEPSVGKIGTGCFPSYNCSTAATIPINNGGVANDSSLGGHMLEPNVQAWRSMVVIGYGDGELGVAYVHMKSSKNDATRVTASLLFVTGLKLRVVAGSNMLTRYRLFDETAHDVIVLFDEIAEELVKCSAKALLEAEDEIVKRPINSTPSKVYEEKKKKRYIVKDLEAEAIRTEEVQVDKLAGTSGQNKKQRYIVEDSDSEEANGV